jgi:hypothetical protein
LAFAARSFRGPHLPAIHIAADAEARVCGVYVLKLECQEFADAEPGQSPKKKNCADRLPEVRGELSDVFR